MAFNIGEQELPQQGRRPYFSRTYTTAANIAVSGVSNERFISEDHEWEHAPFDQILIANLDSVDLAIMLDGNPDNLIPVKAGTTVSASDQRFRNFEIKNLNAATEHTATKILITVQRTYPKVET